MEAGMADPGFPDAHMTATTSAPSYNVGIRFDPMFLRTIPGILKCVKMVLNLIGYICVMSSMGSYHSRASWFSFVSMTGFWVSGILLLLYLLHVVEKFQMVPWVLLEFGYNALWTFFYFTAALACAVWGDVFQAYAGAAFFGFAAMLVYGADTFFKFKAWRSGAIPQGEGQVQVAGDMQSPGAY